MVMEVNSIFSIPLGTYSRPYDEIVFSKEFKAIKELDYVLTSDHPFVKSDVHHRKQLYTAKNKQVLNIEELKSLKKFIQGSVRHFIGVTFGRPMDLCITTSWCNKAQPGQENRQHYHRNSILSGVYYPHEINYSLIRFFSPYKCWYDLGENNDVPNLYNTNMYTVPCSRGRLYLWSSDIDHASLCNDTDEDRYSLAFNVFFEKDKEYGRIQTGSYIKI